MALVRNLDLVILALALPAFLIAGWPLGGYLAAAVIWAMWRGIGAVTDRKAAEADDPKRVVGIATGSMIGRGWLMGLTLLGVGLATNDDVGLAAAVLCVVLFTVSFTSRILLRPFEVGAGRQPNSPTPSS